LVPRVSTAESAEALILVAHTDADKLQDIEDALEPCGHCVFSASDGKSALRLFEALNPDLVILDFMMSGEREETLCSLIRARSQVPVMMVVPKGSHDENRKAILSGLEAGADHWIFEPFLPAELAARVWAILRRSEYGARSHRRCSASNSTQTER